MTRSRLSRLFVAVAIAMNVSCAASQPSPHRIATGENVPDAGLPPPPPAAKKGVIVPADMGLGPGTPGHGPATQSASPAMGAPAVN